MQDFGTQQWGRGSTLTSAFKCRNQGTQKFERRTSSSSDDRKPRSFLDAAFSLETRTWGRSRFWSTKIKTVDSQTPAQQNLFRSRPSMTACGFADGGQRRTSYGVRGQRHLPMLERFVFDRWKFYFRLRSDPSMLPTTGRYKMKSMFLHSFATPPMRMKLLLHHDRRSFHVDVKTTQMLMTPGDLVLDTVRHCDAGRQRLCAHRPT